MARRLRTEIAALESRLDSENRLLVALRTQLEGHEGATADERRTQLFRRAAIDIAPGGMAREFPDLEPVHDREMGDALIAISSRLDHKFAEIKALNEITQRVTSGMFFDEVLGHVFEHFRELIPYNRIGVALIERAETDKPIVRARWNRADYAPLHLKDGYAERLKGSTLEKIIETRLPRIINNLEEYLTQNPRSHASKKILKEGIRSSLTCPLVVQDQVLGFIFFSSTTPDTYRDQHVELFMQIAGELAITLEKSRIYEDLCVRNDFITKVFGQYVTNEVAEAVLRDNDSVSLGGERRKVTVLMADLRGFTPMSEQLSAEEVVDALNIFLGRMVDIVMKYDGSVDNFIGDALLAVFGTPVSKPDDAARAVACAIEMQNAMAGVNEEIESRGLHGLRMGIGLSTGEVVAGNIGSELRMKYSVIGGVVNLAARIESIADGGQVFAADPTYAEAADIIRTDGHLNVKLKGLERPVMIHEIAGIDGPFNIALQAPHNADAIN